MPASGPTERGGYVADVLEAVADREGVDVLDLPPIFDAVDPDALEALLATADDTEVTVSFPYGGYDVTVTSGGRVDVDPLA